MDTIEKLWAIEEIKQLKARYFRALDTKDWDELMTVFTDDAVFDLRAVNSIRHPLTRSWEPPLAGEDQVYTGRETIIAMIRRAVEHLHTVHHGHVAEIEVISPSEAKGLWPTHDELRHASGDLLLTGSGHYDETYEYAGDGWRVKTSIISRLSLDGGVLSVPADDTDA